MKVGEIQTLTVEKTVAFGVYLTEPDGNAHTQATDVAQAQPARVLLPANQVPEGTTAGDQLAVFLYRDSEDRLIATTREPRLTVGGLAALRVAQVTHLGAFLDWGLEKDLFLPYKEQYAGIEAGDEILVTMYVDKSGRLCASMRGLYPLLSTDSPYRAGDAVNGRVYEFGRDFGTFVAVDDRFSAMIPRHEDVTDLRIGDIVSVTVSKVKKDGKLDLTRRAKAYLQIGADAESILALIDRYGGTLPFNDKASPEVILKEAHMSKAAFKRAVGRLYKERRIEITPDSIRRIEGRQSSGDDKPETE